MPPHRRAFKWAGLATAIALAVLVLPALPVAARAEGPALSLAVHVGYHDLVKTGEWMPVSIDVSNDGADFSGAIEVQLGDYATSRQARGTVYVLPLTLPGSTLKHLRTYVVSEVGGLPVGVRVVGGDGRLLLARDAAAASAPLLVGVLSDDPTAFDEFAAIHYANGANPLVVHLARDDVPTSAVLLRGFDLLAIDDFASDSLTPTQRRAIEGYVTLGGSLLLGSGGAWRKTLGALPADLLPLTPAGTQTVAGSRALQTSTSMEVLTGSATGTAWLQEDGRPLILEQAVGQGLVTMAAFDWTAGPATSSTATHSLLRQVGLRSGFGTRSALANGVAIPGLWNPLGPSATITQRSGSFTAALSSLPALELPSLRLIGLLVLLYVVVVGPLNYLVLLRAGRRELAWITVPLIAVTFAGAAYGLALGTKGRSIQANQISIVHLAGAGDQAYEETYTGIIAPTRGDYAVSLDSPQPAIAALANVYGSDSLARGNIRIRPSQAGVDLFGVTAYTLRGWATESTMQPPALTASLSLRNGRLTGTIHNASRRDFSDGLLALGGTFQRLGRLGAGTDLRVDVRIQSAPLANGTLAIPLINRGITVQQVAGSSGVRTAILQSLLTTTRSPSIPRITPVLIAWTDQPLQGLRVNGEQPHLKSESAVVVPLSLNGQVSGPLPAGLVTARLVDASGTVEFGPSGIVLNGGSATYELTAPLTPGSRLANAAITGGNLLTAEVWDWSNGRWQPLGLLANATPLPDGSVDPATGTVRVRLTAIAGDSPGPMGAMSLTGSVQ
jgi:hypothetical protein